MLQNTSQVSHTSCFMLFASLVCSLMQLHSSSTASIEQQTTLSTNYLTGSNTTRHHIQL